MSEKTFYLETGSTDPYYNLAFEEYVLCHRTEGSILMLWQNDNAIIIGQNQNTAAEINRAFVDEHGIRVVRRMTGGGAVYHDMGNLNYSFITDSGIAAQLSLTRFTAPIVAALRSLGLDAEASGRNDILVSGRKVSGTAQRMVGGRILHHGTLLFDSNSEMVAGALNVDPEKFRSKSAKSVRSRIGNIREFLPQDMTMAQFWAHIKKELTVNGFETVSLTPDELAAVDKLCADKYATWDWNFGRSPRYDMSNKRYWDGGCLEVRLSVDKGVLTDICFYGDFLAVCPLDDLTAALRGITFTREAFASVLDRFSLPERFGAITKDEILHTVFDV